MAVGDVFNAIDVVAGSSSTVIYADSGTEVIVHSILFSGGIDIGIRDNDSGLNCVFLKSIGSEGVISGLSIHIKDDVGIYFENNGTSNVVVCVNGIVSKVV